MTFEHLAPESIVNRVLHAPVAFDGASGFIMMSGLVLGIVQRSRSRRAGGGAVVRSLLKRAMQLYAIQAAVVAVALVLGTIGSASPWLPRADSYANVLDIVIAVAALQVNPQNLDILSLYVLLLLLAAACAGLLEHGGWRLVLVLSGVLYVVGSFLPAWTSLHGSPDHLAFFNWGTWQVLFIGAFVGGWHWRGCALDQVILGWKAVLTASVVVVLLTSAAVLAAAMGEPAVRLWFSLSSKGQTGPVRLLMAVAVFVVAYAAVTAASRRWRVLGASPVARLGRYSLRSFVLLTLVTMFLRPSSGDDSIAVALLPYAALVTMYLASMVSGATPSRGVFGGDLRGSRRFSIAGGALRSRSIRSRRAAGTGRVDARAVE